MYRRSIVLNYCIIALTLTVTCYTDDILQQTDGTVRQVGRLRLVQEHRHHSLDNQHRRLRNKRRRILNANKRRMMPPQGDAFNDYVTVSVGKNVILDCKLESYNNEKIVWLRMPKGEVLTLDANRVTLEPRIYSECHKNKSPCWSLHIENTFESDSGYYVCQTNSMQTKYIYLDVLVPPKLVNYNPLDRIDVDQNKNVTLNCEVHGKPTPKIYWYRYHNGSAYEMEKYRNLNMITFLIRRDSTNEYECVADNGVAPTVSKKIYLNVRFAPKIDFMNTIIYQKRDRDVIFDCIVHSNPEPIIEWHHKNNSKLFESDKYNFAEFKTGEFYYYRLYIKNLNVADFGEYYCVAQNLIGITRAKIDLMELLIPTTILPTTTTMSSTTTTIATTTIAPTTTTTTTVTTTITIPTTTTVLTTTTTTTLSTTTYNNEIDSDYNENQLGLDNKARLIKHKSSSESAKIVEKFNQTNELSSLHELNKGGHHHHEKSRLKGHRIHNATFHDANNLVFDVKNKAATSSFHLIHLIQFLIFNILLIF